MTTYINIREVEYDFEETKYALIPSIYYNDHYIIEHPLCTLTHGFSQMPLFYLSKQFLIYFYGEAYYCYRMKLINTLIIFVLQIHLTEICLTTKSCMI